MSIKAFKTCPYSFIQQSPVTSLPLSFSTYDSYCFLLFILESSDPSPFDFEFAPCFLHHFLCLLFGWRELFVAVGYLKVISESIYPMRPM